MSRILVIGAGGLLGSTLMSLGKDEMFGTYNTRPIEGSNLFQLDATKRQNAFKLVEKIKPDLVIDTHSITNVDYCETHPEEAWSVNVEGTKNIAEACKTFGAKMIFISTDYVFDGKKTTGYTEKDKPKPLNYYAKTKLIGEKILEALDVDYIIARTAVLYGHGGIGKISFPLWVVDKLKKKETINVVIDQYNNPTYVKNLAETLLLLYKKDARGLFHITGPECISRYDFAKLTAKTFGLDESLIKQTRTPEINQVARRPEKLNMSNEKLRRVSKANLVGINEGLQALKEQML